jgi:hypothetical protein
MDANRETSNRAPDIIRRCTEGRHPAGLPDEKKACVVTAAPDFCSASTEKSV